MRAGERRLPAAWTHLLDFMERAGLARSESRVFEQTGERKGFPHSRTKPLGLAYGIVPDSRGGENGIAGLELRREVVGHELRRRVC